MLFKPFNFIKYNNNILHTNKIGIIIYLKMFIRCYYTVFTNI